LVFVALGLVVVALDSDFAALDLETLRRAAPTCGLRGGLRYAAIGIATGRFDPNALGRLGRRVILLPFQPLNWRMNVQAREVVNQLGVGTVDIVRFNMGQRDEYRG
jgi:hypothetical protein